MGDVVTYQVDDGIAVIVVNSPRVNALSQEIRAGLLNTINNLKKMMR
jgi:enoyl-CoA hydratase/carnithine racemase